MVSKKDALGVRIDQSGKFSAMTLLRAMDANYSTDTALLRLFYDVKSARVVRSHAAEELVGAYAAEDIVFPPGHERAGRSSSSVATRLPRIALPRSPSPV